MDLPANGGDASEPPYPIPEHLWVGLTNMHDSYVLSYDVAQRGATAMIAEDAYLLVYEHQQSAELPVPVNDRAQSDSAASRCG
jgi:hypothetical protein